MSLNFFKIFFVKIHIARVNQFNVVSFSGIFRFTESHNFCAFAFYSDDIVSSLISYV